MPRNRKLDWDGCTNVRDFGGLKTASGRRIRWGAAVRSDDPAKLSPQGWDVLYGHGIRTIISLRTDGIDEGDLLVPDHLVGLDALALAIENVNDLEFRETWSATDLWSTPLYYSDAIARWPERHAAVFRAIVQAREGGVLIHCARGVDRTGIISIMLLALGACRMPRSPKIISSVWTPSGINFCRRVTPLPGKSFSRRSRIWIWKPTCWARGVSPGEIDAIKNRMLESI